MRDSRYFLCLLRSGPRHRLVNEKACLAPAIQLYDCHQGQAAKQIRSQHVTGPVFAQVNARDTDQGYRDANQRQEQAASYRDGLSKLKTRNPIKPPKTR